MGTVSVAQMDELFWLGRYTERVYTTIHLYIRYYDEMIERANLFADFCSRMEIPNIYASREDFVKRYGYDESNPDSLASNLQRGHDNAIILREVIGSDSLAYIQLAAYAIHKAARSDAPVIELQKVCDNILAFWGIIDDGSSPQVRDLIRLGRRIERVDLYARMHYESGKMKEAIGRLVHDKLVTGFGNGSSEKAAGLEKYLDNIPLDYHDIVVRAENLF